MSKASRGAGSAFTIGFKLTKLDNHQPTTVNEAQPKIPDLKGKLIFIAEDNKINQTVVNAMLRPTGAKYIMFSDGEELIKGYMRKKA